MSHGSSKVPVGRHSRREQQKLASRELRDGVVQLLGEAMRAVQALLGFELFLLGFHPGQAPLVRELWLQEGITPRRLSRILGVSEAAVSRSLTRLERAHLVERRASGDDLRERQIFFTALGRACLAPATVAIVQVDSTITAGLSADDIAALKRSLRMISRKATRALELARSSHDSEQATAFAAPEPGGSIHPSLRVY